MRTFFVCSYGGCGTVMLGRKLAKYGKVEIVHSLPSKTSLETVKHYRFTGEAIQEDQLKKITVIYIYKNPVNSVYSRYIVNSNVNTFGGTDK